MRIIQGYLGGGIRTLLTVGFLLGMVSGAIAASYEVIANKSVPANSISKSDLRSIFLGEKVKWDNNKYIKVVVPEDGAVYKDFLQTVVGKTPSQFDKHWMNLVFTGKASLPQVFGETQKLLDYVGSHPGTISFVPAGQAAPSVKTIAIK